MTKKYFNSVNLIKKTLLFKSRIKATYISSKLVLALTLASFIICPHAEIIAMTANTEAIIVNHEQQRVSFTYDDIISMLDDIEREDFEERYSPSQIDEINHFLVVTAMAGSSEDPEEQIALDEDIQDLYVASFEKSFPYGYATAYQIPSGVVPCGWIKSKCHQTKKFVKKHKTAIIIGTVVVVVAVVVTVVTAGAAAPSIPAAISSSVGASAAAAVASSNSDSETSHDFSVTSTPLQQEIESFKQTVSEDRLLEESRSSLSVEESGRIIGQIFAHQSLDSVANQSSIETVANGHDMIDRFFLSSDQTGYIPTREPGLDFKENVYQARGEYAFELQYPQQAVKDLSKAIEINPYNHEAYLDRASAYLVLGEYDRSLDDYEQYIEQKPALETHPVDFGLAFAKGLPRGIKESGYQLGSFACDMIAHPIDTAGEVGRAFVFLSKLVYSKEWETIAQTLAPEVCELISKWDTLSSVEQGDLAGYAFGKYGSDILIPGASAKLISKGAKEVAVACRALKNAEKTVALEALAQTASSQTATHLRSVEGAVLSSKETGVLGKSVGELSEQARLDSIAKYRKGEAFLKPYQKNFIPEDQIRELIHQAGIQTFPRPKGIPKNYRVGITDRSGGMKYIHPQNPGSCIRVMPGKPHSPFPHQQQPYVVHTKSGKYLDKFGNEVAKDSPQAHIPLSEFTYIGD